MNNLTLEKVIQKLLRLPEYFVVKILAPSWFALINSFEDNKFYLWLFRYPKINSFNRLFYYLRRNTFDSTFFMGKHVLKFPTDLWIYQEIIYEKKPDVIVETGVFLGGSTYYLSKICELVGKGKVIAIDITLDHADTDLLNCENVTLIEGDTSDPDTFNKIQRYIKPDDKVMVVLDSDHHPSHVYAEMKLFSKLVTEGQYLVVEDSIIDRTYPFPLNRGPKVAIQKFLRETSDFIPDFYRNRFLLTHNFSGYLMKCSMLSTRMDVQMRSPDECLKPFRLWLPGQDFPQDMAWLKQLDQNKRQLNQNKRIEIKADDKGQ